MGNASELNYATVSSMGLLFFPLLSKGIIVPFLFTKASLFQFYPHLRGKLLVASFRIGHISPVDDFLDRPR